MRSGVHEAPMGRGPVEPLVDLLADRCVQASVAFGKAAHAQATAETRKCAPGDARDVQLGRFTPADVSWEGRVVASAEDPSGVLPGEDEVDPGLPVAMRAEAANLRQKIGCRGIARESGRGPGAGRVVATEHLRSAGHVPGGSEQDGYRTGQARAVAVGREADFAKRSDGELARTSLRQPLNEDVVYAPVRLGFVENKYLGALRSLGGRGGLPNSRCRRRACRRDRRGAGLGYRP